MSEDALIRVKVMQTGQVIVDSSEDVKDAASGILHKRVLQRLVELNPSVSSNQGITKELELMVDSASEPAKLKNWDRISRVLAIFPGFEVSRA